MNDGAELGLTAGKALGIIFGMDDPLHEQVATMAEVRERIRSAPLPKPNTSIWLEMASPLLLAAVMEQGDQFDGYSLAADSVAHSFLLLAQDDPKTMLSVEAAWSAALAQWPMCKDYWLCKGPYSFGIGWAYNTARWLRGFPVKRNHAITEM